MKLPFNDLTTMTHSPEFIAFRVEINGIEYIGRPNAISTPLPAAPETGIIGEFDVYFSIHSFHAGYRSDRILVNTSNTKILDVIDTVGPEPLRKILDYCFLISQINPAANIGTIKRGIPAITNRLLTAMGEFEVLHGLPRYEVAFKEIEDKANDCLTCPFNLTEMQRSDLIVNIKEKVAVRIANFIDCSKTLVN